MRLTGVPRGTDEKAPGFVRTTVPVPASEPAKLTDPMLNPLLIRLCSAAPRPRPITRGTDTSCGPGTGVTGVGRINFGVGAGTVDRRVGACSGCTGAGV